MKTYFVSAMVVYTDEINADSEEDAKDKFVASCLYDVDESTIEVEEMESEEE